MNTRKKSFPFLPFTFLMLGAELKDAWLNYRCVYWNLHWTHLTGDFSENWVSSSRRLSNAFRDVFVSEKKRSKNHWHKIFKVKNCPCRFWWKKSSWWIYNQVNLKFKKAKNNSNFCFFLLTGFPMKERMTEIFWKFLLEEVVIWGLVGRNTAGGPIENNIEHRKKSTVLFGNFCLTGNWGKEMKRWKSTRKNFGLRLW